MFLGEIGRMLGLDNKPVVKTTETSQGKTVAANLPGGITLTLRDAPSSGTIPLTEEDVRKGSYSRVTEGSGNDRKMRRQSALQAIGEAGGMSVRVVSNSNIDGSDNL